MSRLNRWLRSRRRRQPPPPTPYEHLLTVPRFEVRTELLLDEPLRIPDGHSFYYSYRELFLEEVYRFASASPAPRIDRKSVV